MNILRTCPTALFQGWAAAFFKLSSMLLPSGVHVPVRWFFSALISPS
jgi:hypothetical protein